MRRRSSRFERATAQSTEGSHELLLLARSEAGGEERLRITVETTEVQGPHAAGAESPSEAAPEMRLHIDHPALQNGKAKDPVTSGLTIQGWATARQGVASVEVYLDSQSAGLAYYGQRREDIAGVFPDWDNSLLSGFGFGFRLPSHFVQRLRPGEHQVEVRLIAKTGAETSLSFSFERAEEQQDIPLFRERISGREVSLYEDVLDALDWHPLFRVVLLPAGEQERNAELAPTLTSLAGQVYGKWELLTTVDVPPDSLTELSNTPSARDGGERSVRVLGETFSRSDSAGQAEYLVFARPGDALACDALAEMAVATGLHRDSDLLYSDEVRNNPATGAREAFFKPGWSPDLLLKMNYVGRLCCIRSDVLERAGVSPSDLERFGEYDLVLRCTERASAIRHVPHLLYRRGKSSDEPDASGFAALDRAAERRGIAVQVSGSPVKGAFRFRRTKEAAGKVSIIIPTIAAHGHIKTCLDSLRRLTAYENFEVVAIDNIRDPDSPWKPWLREHCDRVVEILDAFNWSRFNNAGARQSDGEFLLFLNDDVEVIEPDWLHVLLEHAQRPEVGVVGAKLLYSDRKVQHAGIFLAREGHGRHAFRFLGADEPGYFGLAVTERNVAAVTGACMLIERGHFQSMGGFDEAHDVVNNDVDYCLRVLKAGYNVVYTPHARLVHHELASRAGMKDSFDLGAFEKQWGAMFAEGDPFFSPHLLKDYDDFVPDAEQPRLVLAGGPIASPDRIKRVLALKLDHIGDFVIALPAIRRLRQVFPNAELCVLTGRAARVFAQAEPCISEVIEFEFFHSRSGLGRKEVSKQDLAALREKLARYRFDLAVDLRKAEDTRIVLQYTGARYLAGFDHKDRFPWLDIASEWEGDRPLHRKRQHVSEDLIRLVDAIAASCGAERNTLPAAVAGAGLSGIPLSQAARRLFRKRVVCLHPGVGQETRQWPPEHFAALADMLVEKCGVGIALIGGPEEAGLARSVRSMMRNGRAVVTLAGKVALSDLPVVLAASALYVGNNSGPKHIAAGIGVPTVGIHSGVVDATEWGPVGPAAVAIQRMMTCSPCYIAKLEDCARRFACMRELEPAAVFEVCERMLALGGTRR